LNKYPKSTPQYYLVLEYGHFGSVIEHGDSTKGQGWTCKDPSTEAEGIRLKREGNRTTKRQKRKNVYNIVTWNVRSMYEGKLNIVQNEMNRKVIDILGISEMKWIGSGHFRNANNTVMYWGHKAHRTNGVGMIITNQVSKSLIGYKAVNYRIMYIRVKEHPVNITCIQVYSPTTSAETADIEDFYGSLHLGLNEIPKKGVLILMGDWNSKVGKGEEPGTVGRYGLGNRNEAGEGLLDFCEEYGLFLANTYFEQPERRVYTWTSPDGQYSNQIDYILGR
jgi:hypothetical protein